jgi:hypothetical protein
MKLTRKLSKEADEFFSTSKSHSKSERLRLDSVYM